MTCYLGQTEDDWILSKTYCIFFVTLLAAVKMLFFSFPSLFIEFQGYNLFTASSAVSFLEMEVVASVLSPVSGHIKDAC